MTHAYICMGSNMPGKEGGAEEQLQKALLCLEEQDGLSVGALSPLYWTEPQDMAEQPWFANQVLRLNCTDEWTAPRLMHCLLEVEKRLGRERSENPALRYGPRALDLDILLFGQWQSNDPHCTVPHPRMLRRAFVLVPLQDVALQDILPDGSSITQALGQLSYCLKDRKIYQSL